MSSGKLRFGPVGAVGIIFVIAIVAALSGGSPRSLVVVIVVGVLLFALGKVSWEAIQHYRNEFNRNAEEKREAQEAAAREERSKRKQRLVAELGSKNAALVESAKTAAKRVTDSEAARAGWLGDVDFTVDIAEITDIFRKTHELNAVAEQLSTLAKPNANDRKLLADARRTAADLAAKASSRIKLVQQCAAEAEMVDDSLSQERDDARTAEQRAELHAKLSSMLYGIEATPSMDSGSPAADSVIARVQGYREVKNQIRLVRGD
jgi:hypothetical protein